MIKKTFSAPGYWGRHIYQSAVEQVAVEHDIPLEMRTINAVGRLLPDGRRDVLFLVEVHLPHGASSSDEVLIALALPF